MANKDVIKQVANQDYTCEEIYSTHKECSPSFNATYYDGGCSCDVGDDYYTCTRSTGAYKNISVTAETDMACDCPTYIKGLIKSGNINAWDNKGQGAHAKPYHITPMFYDEFATQEEDMTSAIVTLIISLIGLCTCMACLVKMLSYITQNSNQAMLKKAASMDPYIAIGVGTAITILVQSSSITTSVLTPLAASDIISLEQMLPLTLGANIGTTWTSILASLVSAKVEAVQIAICHLTFNVLGIIIWFGLPLPLPQPGPCSGGPAGRGVLCTGPGWEYQWPVPFPYKKEDGKQLQMRDVPLILARKLGQYTRIWNFFPVFYIVIMFVCIPGILLGISSLFDGKAASQTLGWMIVIIVLYFIVRNTYWLYRQDGFADIYNFMERRQKKVDFNMDLQKTVEGLQADIALLKESTSSAV